MNSSFYSYLAGFLDGDGSIYVRLKPNRTYRYGFQIAPSVVFFQKHTSEVNLKTIQSKLEYGYLRYRKDGIIEFTIGDRPSIRAFIKATYPFLLFKKPQATLMLQILDFSEKVTSGEDFLRLAELIDQFEQLNYSKKRTNRAQVVRNHLVDQGILTP